MRRGALSSLESSLIQKVRARPMSVHYFINCHGAHVASNNWHGYRHDKEYGHCDDCTFGKIHLWKIYAFRCLRWSSSGQNTINLLLHGQWHTCKSSQHLFRPCAQPSLPLGSLLSRHHQQSSLSALTASDHAATEAHCCCQLDLRRPHPRTGGFG